MDFSFLPATSIEYELKKAGFLNIAGFDEAGRGCLAGPVVAASVILCPDKPIEGIKDSKLLSPQKRESLALKIKKDAASWAVGIVDHATIDRINILQASLLAMRQAFEQLSICPDFCLIDGNKQLNIDIPQLAVVKGDRYCLSVAAASIIAKVTRDRLMQEFQKIYPNFSFSTHKGYPTKLHRDQIKKFGLLPIHRRSFSLCKEV